MWRTRLVLFCIGIAVMATTDAPPAQALSREQVNREQVAMINRISQRIGDYAREISIDPMFIDYCRIDLSLSIKNVPADGSIPYGVNYNTISDKSALETILSAREVYETGFLMICLAEAKAALEAARR